MSDAVIDKALRDAVQIAQRLPTNTPSSRGERERMARVILLIATELRHMREARL